MQNKSSVLALILIAGLFTAPSNIVAAPIRAILQNPAVTLKTVDSKKAHVILMQTATTIVLDVRTPAEYANGHLKNARNLDFNSPDFAASVSKLDKTKTYLVYCAVGGRSSKAAKMMQEMGFQQIINVSEGYTSLKKSGIPVVEKVKTK